MLDLIIRGGQVVTSWGVGDWDVGIQGEKIVSIAAANSITEEAGRIIDATGKIVAPGGIEPHAHIAAPIMGPGNLTTAPPEQVSRAALSAAPLHCWISPSSIRAATSTWRFRSGLPCGGATPTPTTPTT